MPCPCILCVCCSLLSPPASPTDTFILKTKKLYSDSRTQRNLDKLNSELRDVHSIMTKNINELLERGDRLERMLGVREEPPVDSRRGVWEGAGV